MPQRALWTAHTGQTAAGGITRSGAIPAGKTGEEKHAVAKAAGDKDQGHPVARLQVHPGTEDQHDGRQYHAHLARCWPHDMSSTIGICP